MTNEDKLERIKAMWDEDLPPPAIHDGELIESIAWAGYNEATQSRLRALLVKAQQMMKEDSDGDGQRISSG
jgi:hypothetical protein